jgi:hypothetical protein
VSENLFASLKHPTERNVSKKHNGVIRMGSLVLMIIGPAKRSSAENLFASLKHTTDQIMLFLSWDDCLMLNLHQFNAIIACHFYQTHSKFCYLLVQNIFAHCTRKLLQNIFYRVLKNGTDLQKQCSLDQLVR